MILLLIIAFASFQEISRSVTRCSRLTIVDSRETARVWIAQNLPEGSKIALEAYSPYVDPKKYFNFPMDRLIINDISWYKDQEVDYIIASAGMFKRFFNEPERYNSQVTQYEQFFNTLDLIKTFLDGGYEVRIYRLR